MPAAWRRHNLHFGCVHDKAFRMDGIDFRSAVICRRGREKQCNPIASE
jgi:hypothetical protein